MSRDTEQHWTADDVNWDPFQCTVVKRRRVPSHTCQIEGCNADLSSSKTYFRRYCVCKTHFKAAAVLVAGKPSRFCGQCECRPPACNPAVAPVVHALMWLLGARGFYLSHCAVLT